jgi:site-specific recombinase XerD
MFIYQAITPRELVNITLEELDLEKGTVHIKYSNPKQDRTLALQSNQILLIYNYLNIERPILQGRNKEGEICNNFILNENGKSLFPNCISRLINQNRSKEEKITPFKIRQSAIKNLLKKGNDLRIVQVFAGHRRSSSTEAYKQTGLEELKNVIQKYHPLA